MGICYFLGLFTKIMDVFFFDCEGTSILVLFWRTSCPPVLYYSLYFFVFSFYKLLFLLVTTQQEELYSLLQSV